MTAPASLVAKLLEQTEQDHPYWCKHGSDPVPCDSHYSEPVSVPATSGDCIMAGRGALFPAVDVEAGRRADGRPEVLLDANDPTADGQLRQGSVALRLTPDEAEDLGKALIAAAALARQS